MQRKRQKIREGDEIAFLSRHFVALTCLYEVIDSNDTRSHHSMVISGFLLELHEYYFWVTAGHCLKELDKLLASKGVRLHGGSFMDSFAYGAVHKNPIPFRYEPGCGFCICQPEDGFDFALIPLNLLQIQAFKANNLIPISRANWVHQRDLSFDFYLMLGVPAHRVSTSLTKNGMMSVAVSQSLVRIERIGLGDLGGDAFGCRSTANGCLVHRSIVRWMHDSRSKRYERGADLRLSARRQGKGDLSCCCVAEPMVESIANGIRLLRAAVCGTGLSADAQVDG